MAVTGMAHGDRPQHRSAPSPWLRRLVWAAFAFAIVTCYSAQVAHFYRDGHGARLCERCQGEVHLASEPLALPRAVPVVPPPKPEHPSSHRLISFQQDPQGIRPRGRAPPSLSS